MSLAGIITATLSNYQTSQTNPVTQSDPQTQPCRIWRPPQCASSKTLFGRLHPERSIMMQISFNPGVVQERTDYSLRARCVNDFADFSCCLIFTFAYRLEGSKIGERIAVEDAIEMDFVGSNDLRDPI